MNARIEAIAAEFTDDSATPPLTVSHTGPLWRWKSSKTDTPAAWFFVTIDGAAAEAVDRSPATRRGFASLRVEARIGATRWRTSIFPSKDPAGYLLPVKAAIRKTERLGEGDMVRLELAVI